MTEISFRLVHNVTGRPLDGLSFAGYRADLFVHLQGDDQPRQWNGCVVTRGDGYYVYRPSEGELGRGVISIRATAFEVRRENEIASAEVHLPPEGHHGS